MVIFKTFHWTPTKGGTQWALELNYVPLQVIYQVFKYYYRNKHKYRKWGKEGSEGERNIHMNKQLYQWGTNINTNEQQVALTYNRDI